MRAATYQAGAAFTGLHVGHSHRSGHDRDLRMLSPSNATSAADGGATDDLAIARMQGIWCLLANAERRRSV